MLHDHFLPQINDLAACSVRNGNIGWSLGQSTTLVSSEISIYNYLLD